MRCNTAREASGGGWVKLGERRVACTQDEKKVSMIAEPFVDFEEFDLAVCAIDGTLTNTKQSDEQSVPVRLATFTGYSDPYYADVDNAQTTEVHARKIFYRTGNNSWATESSGGSPDVLYTASYQSNAYVSFETDVIQRVYGMKL